MEDYMIERWTDEGELVRTLFGLNGAKAQRVYEEWSNEILRDDSGDSLVVTYRCDDAGQEVEAEGKNLREAFMNYIKEKDKLTKITAE